MEILYYCDELPSQLTKSIFLAGPTLRGDDKSSSWRKEALKILSDLDYDGVVILPEPKDNADPKQFNYIEIFDWEREMINACDVILFWIPRSDLLPGFTTNIEFGNFIKTGKIVVGAPHDAPKTSYLKLMAEEQKMPWFTTLKDTLNHALKTIGEGALRKKTETKIPVSIFKKPEFQNWYKSHSQNGNELRSFSVEYTDKNNFMWIAHPEIFIQEENRIKSNELVFARPDIVSIILYCPEEGKVVLIKEFRSAVSNKESMVYELPSGMIEGTNLKHQALQELKEETGIILSEEELIKIEDRQIASTTSLHKACLYGANISKDDMDKISISVSNKSFGKEGDSEKTYAIIKTIDEILSDNNVDWSSLGMILSAVKKIKAS